MINKVTVNSIFVFALAFNQMGCSSESVSNSEMQVRIDELEQALEECQNGPDKLLAEVIRSHQEGEYARTKQIFLEMKEKYPDRPQFEEADSIYQLAEKAYMKEQEALKKKLAEANEARLKALNSLKKEVDDVAGLTWYHQPFFTHYTNTNRTSIYMGKSNGDVWIRLRMSYTGEDWIFFDNAYLSYDGKTREIQFDKYSDKESDNDAGDVWEWIDVTLTEDLIPYMREFAQSPNAKMRLTGKYSKTRKLSRNERRGILLVLDGYDALKAK